MRHNLSWIHFLLHSPKEPGHSRSKLVGRCEHIIWHQSCPWRIFRSVEVRPRFPRRPKKILQHWLGRSSSSRAWPTPSYPIPPPKRHEHTSTFRQFWNCFYCEQGPIPEQGNKQDSKARIFTPSKRQHPTKCNICLKSRKHCRCTLLRSDFGVPPRFPLSSYKSHCFTSRSPIGQAYPLLVATLLTPPITPQSPDLPRAANGLLQLHPSPLRPNCKADERIFNWVGINTPPATTIDSPVIRYLADLANHASLRDTGSYGSGLRNFHIFCDVFSIPESQWLPASFQVLYSFALWAATDTESIDPLLLGNTQFEPVSVGVIKKYLSAVRACHIAQGWPAPLEADHDRIQVNWSLRSLENLQGT